MAAIKLVLTFPPRLIREPITCRLIKEHNLMVNILRASISPEDEGRMVVELEGDPASIASGRAYLDRIGVICAPLTQDVRWIKERCVHCTACVAACPSGALPLDRTTMRISFDDEKCIGCGLCVPVCSYRAMEVKV